jgi:hypothetical protein
MGHLMTDAYRGDAARAAKSARVVRRGKVYNKSGFIIQYPECLHADFIHRHENLHTLYFEIGVGANTPVIIKYPFWAMTRANPKAKYACLNYNEAFCPHQIENQSICIDGDADTILASLK